MVSIKASQAAAFLKAPPASLAAVLFFGTDPGLVAERAQAIAQFFAKRETPEGEIIRIDESELDSEPGRVMTELQTQPMFSGRQIVRVTAGRKINGAFLKDILAEAPFEGFLVVEAGNLRPDDALRALFEKNPQTAAVACYPDSAADIESLITEVLSAHHLRIDHEARGLLQARLGADRALSRAEIEKLALYAADKDQVSADDVDAIVGDAADLALERIAEAAAGGRAVEAVGDYGRAISSGESAQVIILIMQRYFLKLHRVRSDVDSGRSLEEALRGLRPQLHFRQRDAFSSQVRHWPRTGLESALKRIGETAIAARLSSQLEDTLGERLVLAISAMADATRGGRAARRR